MWINTFNIYPNKLAYLYSITYRVKQTNDPSPIFDQNESSDKENLQAEKVTYKMPTTLKKNILLIFPS